MIRLIVMILLFLLSLLTVFRAPTNWLWYVSILVTECSWAFISIATLLLVLHFGKDKYKVIASLFGIAAIVLFTVPVISAYHSAPIIKKLFTRNSNAAVVQDTTSPYSFWQTLRGINAKTVSYKTFVYDTANNLTLDFYPSSAAGKRPCIIVVHGGSWSGGDSQQLPELNSKLALAGYAVASINYRLAPRLTYPAPVTDVQTTLTYLRAHANDFMLDTNNFVLLGRSAGGQIVLSAAYTLNDPGIKGVISFYGPADMVWGYANPTNPLVLNSCKIMEDYLGGTYSQTPQQYISSSATETATAGAPPSLLIHGENDPLVSPLHGVRLGKKLDSLGVKHYDVYLPWATHGFDWTLNGPAGQLSTWSVLQFLKIVLPE